jgi:acetyl-CoA synthetase
VITTEHDLTGNELEAYVVPETGTVGDDGLRDRIVEHVTATVGPHARPAAVTFVETLPRTPGGALARRPLAAHASGEPLDGIDTLVGVDWLLARTSDAAGGGGVQS